MPGSSLSEKYWRNCLDALAGANRTWDYIVASGSLPPDVPDVFYAQVARIGKGLGARVIIDTSGNSLRLALQEGVYLIKPNIEDAERLYRQLIDET